MQKVFIGLLVAICVIIFASPLMAADLSKGLDLSTLQAVDDAQLDQLKGQGIDWTYNLPPAFQQAIKDGALNGLFNADAANKAFEKVSGRPDRGADWNSRVFQNTIIDPSVMDPSVMK